MQELVYATKEEFDSDFNDPVKGKDPEFLNAVLSGKVMIGAPEETSGPEETDLNDEVNDLNNEVQQPVESSEESDEEAERARKYAEFQKKQQREEERRAAQEALETERQKQRREQEARIQAEKKARELEARLNELQKDIQDKHTTQQSAVTIEDDDDEYASEYSKKNRQMLKAIADAVESLKGSNSQDKVSVLEAQISELKAQEEKRIQAENERKRVEAKERELKNTFDELTEFQQKYKELKTEKSVDEIYKDWERFRKDMYKVSGARNQAELEAAIAEYNKGGKIKEVADGYGIKGVPDFDKFEILMNLVDLKDGLEYDPVIGDYKPVTDRNGNKVNYRSVEDAYRVSNYYDELNEARKRSYKEYEQKMRQLENAPVTLDSGSTRSTINAGGEQAAETDLLNHFWANYRDYANRPDELRKIEMIMNKRGMKMPDLSAYRRRV